MLVHIIKRNTSIITETVVKLLSVSGHMTRAPYLCGAAAEEVQD